MYKDLKEKFGFTLGATHVGIFNNTRRVAFTLAEGATHVGIFNNTRRVGFTLAEVLITLGIIGIVSAMTIPTLVKEYKKKQTIAKLQQTYSILSQAITRAQVDNGDVSTWAWKNSFGEEFTMSSVETSTTNFFNNYLKPYIKINQDYGFNVYDKMLPNYDCCYGPKSVDRSTINPGYYFLLNNGVIVGIIVGTACSQKNEDGSCAVVTQGDIHFRIGIGGTNEKAISGINLFQLFISSQENKLKFYSSQTYRNREDAKLICQNTPLHCGALIQIDGWKLSDDYPWQ